MFHPGNSSAMTPLLLSAGAAAVLLATAPCRPPASEEAVTRTAEIPAPSAADAETAARAMEDEVMRTYGKDDREITATIGERFVIALEANPATGYEWTAEVEERRLRPVDRSLRQAASGPESAPLGAPVIEEFVFEALSAGESSIRLEYRRPWEEEALEVLVFSVRAATPRPRSP